MKAHSVEDLMYIGMTYVLDFEQKFAKQAEKMAKAASDSDVKDIFQKTTTQSKKYAERVEAAFSKLGKSVKTENNYIADAMIEEVNNMISNTEEGPVRDAALIVAFNQQQAYRVSTYGSLSSYAKLLGKEDAVADLNQSLEESKTGDKKLTDIAEGKVNPRAKEVQPVAA